jgi:hypothetical protein
MAVTIRDVTSNSTNYAHSIFPSTFNISRELAYHYPRTVSFFPPVAGTFTIEVVVTGPFQHEFVVKYPTGKVLQVLGEGEEPPCHISCPQTLRMVELLRLFDSVLQRIERRSSLGPISRAVRC